EVALAGRVLSGHELALEAEPARERAHHAVDGAPFLRAAREVDAADDQLGLELRRGERGLDELHEAVAQERELLRKAVEQGAARRAPPRAARAADRRGGARAAGARPSWKRGRALRCRTGARIPTPAPAPPCRAPRRTR